MIVQTMLPLAATDWHLLRFTEPLWLVLLLLLVPVVYLWATSRVPATRFRRWTALVLRSLLVVALVLALSGARLAWPNRGVCVAFLLDQSQSVPQEARDLLRERMQQEIAKMSRYDQFMVIEFGGMRCSRRCRVSAATFRRRRR